jgi:hypothetical protein
MNVDADDSPPSSTTTRSPEGMAQTETAAVKEAPTTLDMMSSAAETTTWDMVTPQTPTLNNYPPKPLRDFGASQKKHSTTTTGLRFGRLSDADDVQSSDDEEDLVAATISLQQQLINDCRFGVLTERRLQMMIAKGVDIDQVDGDGNSGCIIAAGLGNLVALNAIIKAGGSVNAKGNGGCTPLITAAHYGQVATLTALLNVGADTEGRWCSICSFVTFICVALTALLNVGADTEGGWCSARSALATFI